MHKNNYPNNNRQGNNFSNNNMQGNAGYYNNQQNGVPYYDVQQNNVQQNGVPYYGSQQNNAQQNGVPYYGTQDNNASYYNMQGEDINNYNNMQENDAEYYNDMQGNDAEYYNDMQGNDAEYYDNNVQYDDPEIKKKKSPVGIILGVIGGLLLLFIIIIVIIVAVILSLIGKSKDFDSETINHSVVEQTTQLTESDFWDFASEDNTDTTTEATTEVTTEATTEATTETTTEETTEAPVSVAEYVIPDSHTRLVSASELYGLTKEELRIARNEIYARHGRMFKDESLQAYFNSKSWYVPIYSPDEFPTSLLNDIERKNVETIKAEEATR